MLNHHIFGLKPWGFHLVNVLFHAGVSVLVFFLAARLPAASSPGTSEPSPAGGRALELFTVPFIAALFFAVHPIHTEAVAWVAGLPDLSFSFFFLLSFLLYIRSTEGKKLHKGRYALSVAFFFLSSLSKEPALTLPIVLILYDFVGQRDKSGHPFHFWRHAPYLIVAASYMFLRSHALGSFAPVMPYRKLVDYEYLINIFPLFALYLEKLLLPINLNPFHAYHPVASILEFKGILGIIVSTAYAVAMAIAFRKSRVVFLSLVLIILPLLPAFVVPALGEISYAERYLYLPSVGFAILIASTLIRVHQKLPRHGLAILLFSISLAALYAIQTVGRNTDWKDDLTLFTDSVKKSPDAAKPRKELEIALGIALLEKGRVAESIVRFENAISMDPSDFRVYNNRGLAFDQMGRPDLAMADFERAIALKPRSYEAYNNKGKVSGQAGSLDKAIVHFSKAIAINPDFSLAYGNRGVAYAILGDFDRALKDIDRAIELDRNYAEAYFVRGNIHLRKGNNEGAVLNYRKACDLGNQGGCRALQALLPPTGYRGRQ